MSKAPEKVIVGRIGAPHGVKGWVKIISFTEPTTNILDYQPWLIQQKNHWVTVTVDAEQVHANAIVVKLPGCDDRDTAQTYTNADIAITADQLPALETNEFYWHDLIGATVINLQQVTLGVVDHLIATGSNDVMIVKAERERLIPYISQVIKKVDLEAKQIIVDWDADF